MDPLPEEQLRLIDLLERTYQENRTWPPWQFVEQSMDIENLDGLSIASSLPQAGQKQGIYGLRYGLTWSKGMVDGVIYQPGDPIGLTVLGHHHAGATEIVAIFLRVLTLACRKLATFQPDPKNVVTLELTSEEVFRELIGAEEEIPALSAPELYELLSHEPATWTGSRGISQDGTWRWEISRVIRPYANVRTLEDYVDVVIRATEESTQQVSQIVPLAPSIPYLILDPLAAITSESSFTPQVPLLGSAVDAELWEWVRPLVESGRWEQVARESAAFVETRARDWTGSKRDVLHLMSDLLAPTRQAGAKDPETILLHNEQEGWHSLARGFFQAIRNHVMHNSVGTEEELQYGMGALGTASLLVRRIRAAATPPTSREAK
jgi:hypothetical protein